MDISAVQLVSSESAQNLSQTNKSQDVDINGTGVDPNGSNDASDLNEGEGHPQQPATLPDATETESGLAEQPPTPATNSPGISFLEYVLSSFFLPPLYLLAMAQLSTQTSTHPQGIAAYILQLFKVACRGAYCGPWKP